MTVDVTQFHQVFFEESLEHLAAMEAGLLALGSGSGDGELINVIFRGAHSIKGGSGTFGFEAIASFTHTLETLLECIRAGKAEATPEIVAVCLESVDVLRDMIGALQAGRGQDSARATAVQQRLAAALANFDATGRARDARSLADDGPCDGWRIRFHPHRHFFHTGNDPGRILRELADLGDLEVRLEGILPDFTTLDPEECHLGWNLTLRGSVPRGAVEEVFAWVEGDSDLLMEPLTAPVDAKKARPAAESAAPAERRFGGERRATDGESIRVGIEKIDAIINLVGELVITQSMLREVGAAVHIADGAALERLHDGLAQLARNTRELQEGVMRIRMLPISFAFSRFPRLVHDLSRKLGKQVELKLAGEQTELDKTVMEKIGDPLVHLVRNALDHGIESPEQRRASGKPETGQIRLNACHQGGNIVIEISDDGAGLNRARIAAKARERGLLTHEAQIDDQRLIDLIFEPGFSTAETVSDVSGRGVGMDVVRRNVRDLGGNVEVSSREGQGSRFTIRLPLTLAILDGQLVRIGDHIYVIPLVSIVESLQIRPGQTYAVAGRERLYRLREEYIPVMDLRRVFESGGTAQGSDNLLVVVEGEGRKIGLVVDDLLGQQQVVIKSLESNYRPVAGISGATILGDGTVALILDTARLVNINLGGARSAASDSAVAA